MPISTSEKLNPIVPFNLLIDTDVGFVRCVKSLKVQCCEAIVDAPVKALITLLSERKTINPLSISRLDIVDDIDKLYNELLTNKYKEVISKSVQTDLLVAVKLWNNSEGAINPTILCSNEYEVSVLKAMKLNFNCIIGDFDSINLKAYDPIYFKDFRDCLKCKSLEGKNIYIANYDFNFTKNEDNKPILLPEISILLLDKNLPKLFEVYNKDQSYIINY